MCVECVGSTLAADRWVEGGQAGSSQEAAMLYVVVVGQAGGAICIRDGCVPITDQEHGGAVFLVLQECTLDGILQRGAAVGWVPRGAAS